MTRARSIYASTGAEDFGKVPGFTPEDWLECLLHLVLPTGWIEE